MYGASVCAQVNEARYYLFEQRLKRNKIIDLALIPPCFTTLFLHLQRSLYVAFLWQQSLEPMVETLDIKHYGWTEDGDIIWTDDIYPQDLIEI